MFHQKRKSIASHQNKSLKDLTVILSSTDGLSDGRRTELIEHMREFSGFDVLQFDSLCLTLIHNVFKHCQRLPETTHSYYAALGGLVDHALNRTEAALQLFRQFLVQEKGSELSDIQKLWIYALLSAGLLQGIGKLKLDYCVELFDEKGADGMCQLLKQWNPLLENLTSTGHYYHFDFLKESETKLRHRLNIVLACQLMPASGFAWIASNSDVLAVWLALLQEDSQSTGTLGAILDRADAIALQRYLHETMFKPVMIRNGERAGKMGTFVDGLPESLTSKERQAGAEFVQWLIKALDEGTLALNKVPLLVVPGGVLMCDEVFRQFVRENGQYKNWQAIQKGFLALGLHQTAVDGSVISRVKADDIQQMVSGVVFTHYGMALPNTVHVHNVVTGKVAPMSAMDVMTLSRNAGQVVALRSLAASGQWKDAVALPLLPLGRAPHG